MKFRRHAIGLALGLCFIGLALGLYFSVAGSEEESPVFQQSELSFAYQTGDFAKFISLLRPLAEQGDADAQFSLGKMYDDGWGVAQDHQEAAKWYRLAAEHGNASAQRIQGGMYESGQGVAKDYREAARWYRLAAVQGDIWAQADLGELYAKGRGVAKDYQEAVKWYRLAAGPGNPIAQFDLGVMYQYGRGVPSNRVVAYVLYSLSAANDIVSPDEASANRTRLAQTMYPQEIEAGQALTRELSKSDNLLNALDQYVKMNVSKSAK